MNLQQRLETIKQYGTSDVSDVLMELGYKDYFVPDLKAYGRHSIDFKLIGKVYTVELVHVSNQDKSKIPEGQHWIDNIEKDSIVLVKQPEGLKNAVLGGLLGYRALKQEATGVVVLGYIRDSEELEEMGLKVLAYGTSVLSSKGFTKAYKLNGSIQTKINQYHSFETSSNNYLYSDKDGTVVFPIDKLDEIVTKLQNNSEVEKSCFAALKLNETLSDAFKKYR
ncbi:RraA-like protein [Neoconidiobolus thromboides FSU 785]|nr:RraA-like protein [Neoconidiobolus thromboides FSU 785]